MTELETFGWQASLQQWGSKIQATRHTANMADIAQLTIDFYPDSQWPGYETRINMFYYLPN